MACMQECATIPHQVLGTLQRAEFLEGGDSLLGKENSISLPVHILLEFRFKNIIAIVFLVFDI